MADPTVSPATFEVPPEQQKMTTPYGTATAQREVLPKPSKTSKAITLLAACGRIGAAGEEGETINVEPALADVLIANGGAVLFVPSVQAQ